MPDESLRVPALVPEIEKGASELRAAATELSERIKKFEAWLNRLPGKTPASCSEAYDNEGRYSFCISFERDGKDWQLVHYVFDDLDESTSGSTPLRDASVETKVRAVSMFPLLLQQMAAMQKAIAESARRATQQFDDFAKGIGIKEGA